MALKTKIEYVDSTHNFWIGGCEPISEGCKNCFAEKLYKRFWGEDFSKPIKSKNFDAPLKWKKPRVILVNDMSDFFHFKFGFSDQRSISDIYLYDDFVESWVLRAFEIFYDCPQHIFLLLTKRPYIAFSFFCRLAHFGHYDFLNLENVWLGVSVENQKTADERIPEFLKIPHFKKWISVEPLLGSLDLSRYFPSIRWVIVGGETGKGARPMQAEWAILIRDHCNRQGVHFFMKQMSNKEPIPKDLQVREYPPEIQTIRGNE